jgi:hypothetical protein
MKYWVFAFAAVAAAGMVSAQPSASADAAQARAAGIAQAKAALAATSAAPQGIVLWRNIEDGMSVARLHALYPESGGDVSYKDDRTVLGNVEVIPGCEAKVNIMHPEGSVSEIVMRGDGSIAGRCSLKMITALSGKYGEPMDKDKVGESLFGRHGKNYIWAHDGVTLQFKRYTGGILGGDGILQASWELRYSAVSTKVDL